MITYDDFLNQLKTGLRSKKNEDDEDDDNLKTVSTCFYCYHGHDSETEKETIGISWVIGGSTGRSCWGGEARGVDGETEPDFEELDTILEHFAPEITFLKYKKLCTALIETGEGSDGGDYYGNYYQKAWKKISLRKLYDYMVEQNLIS